ncbi:hypothetical protein TDB9533_00860 [Thalassocella blandensis]|nr:hypothetical protein TDB9533_00860 [Thalassocella blandensis]
MRLLIVVSLIVFFTSGKVTAANLSTSETLLKGFVKWQASRVEKAALDSAISDIANDSHIERYFPLTSNGIKLYSAYTSARRLVPLMQYNIEQDIDKLNDILAVCIPSNVNLWVKDIDENTFTVNPDNTISFNLTESEQRDIYIKVAGLLLNLYNISSRPESPHYVVTQKNLGGIEIVEIEEKSGTYTVSNFYQNVCPKLPANKQDLSDKLSKEKYVAAIAFSVLNMVAKYNSLDFDTTSYKSGAKSVSDITFPSIGVVPKEITSYFSSSYINKLTAALREYNRISKEFSDDKVPFVVKATSLFSIVEQFTPPKSKDISGFLKLKSTTIFLASLVDAGKSAEPDNVVAVLDLYVDDIDVMNRKRSENSFIVSTIDYTTYDGVEKKVKTSSWRTSCHVYGVLPCQNTIFIGSYYGFSYTKYEKEMGMDRVWHPRAFGPVGIEFKLFSFQSSPVTIMYAPFDIGNYVTNELTDQEYSAKFSDIVAPSAFLSYTVKGKPISLLAGYQWDMILAENFETEGPFVSIAYDLPIFGLY